MRLMPEQSSNIARQPGSAAIACTGGADFGPLLSAHSQPQAQRCPKCRVYGQVSGARALLGSAWRAGRQACARHDLDLDLDQGRRASQRRGREHFCGPHCCYCCVTTKGPRRHRRVLNRQIGRSALHAKPTKTRQRQAGRRSARRRRRPRTPDDGGPLPRVQVVRSPRTLCRARNKKLPSWLVAP